MIENASFTLALLVIQDEGIAYARVSNMPVGHEAQSLGCES